MSKIESRNNFSSHFLCCFRSRQSLKVREHKVLGPYVDGLSQLAVTNFEVRLSPISLLRFDQR